MKLQGGILTFDLFRSENEVASRTYRKVTLDDGEEEWKLVDITTVRQDFPEYCKDLREGKWLLFWASIDDFGDMPLRIFKCLQQAFKENDCADLLNKLIEATEYAQEAIIRKLEEMGR